MNAFTGASYRAAKRANTPPFILAGEGLRYCKQIARQRFVVIM